MRPRHCLDTFAPVALSALIGVTGCTSGNGSATEARLAVQVGALQLEDVTDASFTLTVTNALGHGVGPAPGSRRGAMVTALARPSQMGSAISRGPWERPAASS